MISQPEIISGGTFSDERGTLSFVNDFNLKEIKRFYSIEHPDTDTVRAWQGHKIEQKWFFVSAGSFKISLVKIDDWENPSKDLEVRSFILTDDQPQVLHVPAGYANGIRAVKENSKLLIFSDLNKDDSMADNIRFDNNYWAAE